MNTSRHTYHSDSIFLTDGNSTVYYRDLAVIAHRVRTHTESADSPVIAIDTSDRFQAILWMASCWMAHLPFVPFHPEDPAPLGAFQPDLIVSPHAVTANPAAIAFTELARPTSHDDRDLGRGSTLPGAPTLSGVSYKLYSERVQAHGTQQIPRADTSGFPGVSELHSHPDRVFCGLLTSGSSGLPKRVPLLRRQMIAAAANAGLSSASTDNVPAESLWGHPLPLYHAGGVAIVFRALLSGTGIFLWDGFDAGTILRALKTNRAIRRISLVPTMLKRLVDEAGRRESHPIHSLDCVLVGGGPYTTELEARARRQGWPAAFSYGMTETCGQISAQNPDGSSPAGSVGRALPGHEVQITDRRNQLLPSGETGILQVRGPQVFDGYLPEQQLLKAYRPGGEGPEPSRYPWFETGDYARLDSDDHLFIESRRTDMVVTGGLNVPVADVEAALAGIPGVRDAAVTGLPDEEWGQILVALVVADGEISAEQLQQTLAGQLPPHQVPKRLFLTDHVPRSSLGKIRREKVRQEASRLHRRR
ncbi:fatty acid--CoA ligase family protein [Balneolales bacterium ANBcel1]|nr:fatty acid--CoA ligase family protein [Balneolales bacterium ANBcel1]